MPPKAAAKLRSADQYKRALVQKGLKEVLETVGSVAVLIGLVFVGFKLRQNTAALQSVTSQGLLEQSDQANFLLATNPELDDLVSRGAREWFNEFEQRRGFPPTYLLT